MKEWLSNYWWAVWGVAGSILYFISRAKSGGGKYLRRDPEEYSNKRIFKQATIVMIGLALIMTELILVKSTK